MANIRSNKAKAPKGASTKKPLKINKPSKCVTSDSNNDISKQVILTRSGRIRKKTDERLKVLEPILKTELLIKGKRKMNDNIVSNGEKKIKNNNNDSAVSDQNIEFETVVISSIEVSYNENTDIHSQDPQHMISDVTDKSTTENVTKPKNKKQTDNKKPKENFTMDKEVRKDVINQMKNALSPENDEEEIPKTNPKKHRKLAKREQGVEKDTESDAPEEYKVLNKPKKPRKKQVTLSNGLVLTLSVYSCPLCDKNFSTQTSLSRHKATNHQVQPSHICEHCKKKFRNKTTLKRHLLKIHSELHTQPEYHFCGICDKVFLMKENLELHLASHVKSEKYRCIYCFKTFSYQMLLDQHEKSHHSEVGSVYKCFLCEMELGNRYKLQMHMKIHTKTKEYICHQCGKGFLRFNSIKRHVMVSHSGHRIQCPICYKELTGHLAEHLRVHEDNRPYKCPECEMAFKQSTQLTVHRRCHSGVRPYTCRICERPFSHSNALMLHIRRHTGEKPFACAMCPMTFSQLPHMKTHMYKIHGKDSTYKCEKCKHFFKRKAQLEDHSKICTVGDNDLAFKEQDQTSVQGEEIEVESVMSISRMRYLLALLLTMIASKTKLKYLGENILLIVY